VKIYGHSEGDENRELEEEGVIEDEGDVSLPGAEFLSDNV